MRLQGLKCAVRDWSPADKTNLVEFADNRRIWRNLTHFFPNPYTDADAEEWIASATGEANPSHWAIEVEGRAAGGIGVSLDEGVYAKSGDFGYWLGEPFWGRGIMTEAVQLVVPYAMKRFGLCRLEASVFAWNPASMSVLEHCGFAREGVLRCSVFKDGEVIDQVVYACVQDPRVQQPTDNTRGRVPRRQAPTTS